MSSVPFSAATEVEQIAERLIDDRFAFLSELDVRIEYRFTSKITKKNGKVILGTARKITGLSAHWGNATDPFFAIIITELTWHKLKPLQKEALVDHELRHLYAEQDEESGEVVLSILGHDFEGFCEEIKRYGAWKSDVEQIIKASHEAPYQLSFDEAAA